MKQQRSILLIVAAWLFLPPLVFPTGAVLAQPESEAAAPQIERFDVDPPRRLAPGEALIFRISGSPSGSASVKIDGVKGKVALKEVFVGIYEGAYTLVNGDKVAGNSVVIGTLRVGNQERSTVLDQPLLEYPRVAASQLIPARHTYQ